MAKGRMRPAATHGAIEHVPPPLPPPGDEDTFDDLFHRRWLHPFAPFAQLGHPLPSVDIIERDDHVIVRAEVPGYRRQDLDIVVSNRSLTIRGARKEGEKEARADYFRCEMSHHGFSRTVVLPAPVDEAKARARVRDGILELTLAKRARSKRPPARARRPITVA